MSRLQIRASFYKFAHAIANLGIIPGLSKDRSKILFRVNLLAFTIGLITLPYVWIFYWAGSALLGSLVIFIVSGYFLVPVSNKFGFSNFSRILLVLVGNVAVGSYSFILGRDAGTHLYYFALISYPFLAFELKERFKLVFGLVLPLTLYSLLEWKLFSFGPWIYLTPSTYRIVSINIAFSCFLTLIAAFSYFAFSNRNAEAQLEQSLFKLQSIFDNVSDTIYLLDKDYKFKFINSAVSQYGVTPELFIGKTVRELMVPSEAEIYERHYREVFNTGKWKKTNLCLTNSTNGEVIYHSLVLSPILDSDGKAKELIGIARDMTEEHKTNEKLALAKAEAEAANRIKDEFLAMLSHELRTPLTTILSWAQLLRSGKLSQEKTVYGASILEQSAKAQGQLINDLLDVSRIQSGKLSVDLQEVNPIDIMDITLNSVRSLADGKSIELKVLKDPSVGVILADPIRLQQVFWNLLTNSIKFTPNGGMVEVSVERVRALNSVQEVKVRIKDTGKGIKPEFVPHLFKRFSQADSSSTRVYSGLGLGLAIVRSLIELHGGKVNVESAGENQGATFIVTLPMKFDSTEFISHLQSKGVSGASSKEPARLDGLTILLVDDEVNVRRAVSFILESLGAQVIPASSVKESVEILKKTHPHILVSDIAMPFEDGYSLIQQARAIDIQMNRKTPALALTAYAGAEDIRRVLEAGFSEHLAKPVDAVDLSFLIKKIARRFEA